MRRMRTRAGTSRVVTPSCSLTVKRLQYAALSLVAVLVNSGSAIASEPLSGPYLIGSLGWTHYESDLADRVRDSLPHNAPIGVTSAGLTRNHDFGFQVGAGYQLLPWLGFEVAYVNLGGPRAAYGTTLQSDIRLAAESVIAYDLHGVTASVVGTLPIGDALAVYAKVGAFRSRLGYSETVTVFSIVPPGPPRTTESLGTSRQTRVGFGLGGEYRIAAHVSLRLGWDRFPNVGDNTVVGHFKNVDLLSGAALFRF
jgi:OmpA-like transmembrane domain